MYKVKISEIAFHTVIFCTILFLGVCQLENDTEVSTGTYKEVTVVKGTMSAVEPTTANISCEAQHDCKSCVASSKCYFCETDDKCRPKVTEIFTDNDCNLKKIHYLTCRVNFQSLIIGGGVAVGIVLLILIGFTCYCCCKRKGVKISKDDLKWARQKEERKQIAAERRKERAERTEEIRKKYGLVKDSNPYQRFDA